MPERAAHYAELVSDECAGRIDGIELLSFRCFKAQVCHATGKRAARDECIRLICEEINADIPIMDILVIFMNSASFCLKSEMMMLFAGNGNFRAIDMAVKDRQSSEADYFPEN